MCNNKPVNLHTAIKLSLVILVLVIINLIYNYKTIQHVLPRISATFQSNLSHNAKHSQALVKLDSDYNVWLIFTKVIDKSPLMHNFHRLITNLNNVSSVALNFHVIVDNTSRILAGKVFEEFSGSKRIHRVRYYHIEHCAGLIRDIVGAMTPYFSSKPGTYYSDALFYVSLGLYRIAPENQTRAIMLDCDLYFKEDIAILFKEFDSFTNGNLLALAPELSPVYRHILHTYKHHHNTTFGDYYNHNNTPNNPNNNPSNTNNNPSNPNNNLSNSNNNPNNPSNPNNLSNNTNKIHSPLSLHTHSNGYQGYNSGVILFNFSAIRTSSLYAHLITESNIRGMVDKYAFRGHLGDQDFYTLVGYESPGVIKTLSCAFNRQLCTWWKQHGYKEVFDKYFSCPKRVVVLHGNCNTNVLRYL